MSAPTKIKAAFLLSGDRIKVEGDWFTVAGLHGLRDATRVAVDVRERTYGMQFGRDELVEYVQFQRVAL